jgi:hypothetical protein
MGFSLDRNANQHFQDQEFKLNRGDLRHAPMNLGSELVRRRHLIFKGTYDFSVQGGAIATLALYELAQGSSKKQALLLPANFIISKVLIDVITPLTSGGSATVALTSGQGAGDLLAATAYGSVTGLMDGIPTTAAASNIKIPSTQASPGSKVSAVIAGATVTAGKFNVFIQGFLSD